MVAVSYTVGLEGGAHGQLDVHHLADHPTAVAALQGVLKVGSPLGSLLVLERAEVCCNLMSVATVSHTGQKQHEFCMHMSWLILNSSGIRFSALVSKKRHIRAKSCSGQGKNRRIGLKHKRMSGNAIS